MTNRDCKFTLLIYLYDVPPSIFCYLYQGILYAGITGSTTALHIVLEAAQIESKNLPQTPGIQAEKGFQHHG